MSATRTLKTSLNSWDYVIGRVRPFANADNALPLIASVKLFELGGILYAVASDRYRIVAHRHEDVEISKGFRAVIPINALKALSRITRHPRKNDIAAIILRHKEGDTKVAVSVTGLGVVEDLNLTVELVDEGSTCFPPIDGIVAGAIRRPGDVQPSSFLTHLLEEMLHHSDPGSWVRTAGKKPAIVAMGANTIGIIMPNIGLNDTPTSTMSDEDSLKMLSEQWKDLLASTEEATAA